MEKGKKDEPRAESGRSAVCSRTALPENGTKKGFNIQSHNLLNSNAFHFLQTLRMN